MLNWIIRSIPIITLCVVTVRSKNVSKDTEEEKRSGGWEKGNKKRNGERYLSTWTACDFCMITYSGIVWQCGNVSL